MKVKGGTVKIQFSLIILILALFKADYTPQPNTETSDHISDSLYPMPNNSKNEETKVDIIASVSTTDRPSQELVDIELRVDRGLKSRVPVIVIPSNKSNHKPKKYKKSKKGFPQLILDTSERSNLTGNHEFTTLPKCHCKKPKKIKVALTLLRLQNVVPESTFKVNKKGNATMNKSLTAREEAVLALEAELEFGLGCKKISMETFDQITKQEKDQSNVKCLRQALNHLQNEAGLRTQYDEIKNRPDDFGKAPTGEATPELDKETQKRFYLMNKAEENTRTYPCIDEESKSETMDPFLDLNNTGGQTTAQQELLAARKIDTIQYKVGRKYGGPGTSTNVPWQIFSRHYANPKRNPLRVNIDEFRQDFGHPDKIEDRAFEDLYLLRDHRREEAHFTRDYKPSTKYGLGFRVITVNEPLLDKGVQEVKNMLYLGDTKHYEGIHQQKCYFTTSATNKLSIFFLKHYAAKTLRQYITDQEMVSPVKHKHKFCKQFYDMTNFIEYRYFIIKQILDFVKDLISKGLIIREFSLVNVCVLDNFNVRLCNLSKIERVHPQIVVRHNMELAELFGFTPGRLYNPGLDYDHDMEITDDDTGANELKKEFINDVDAVVSEIFQMARAGVDVTYIYLYKNCIQKHGAERFDDDIAGDAEALLKRISQEYYSVYYKVRDMIRNVDNDMFPKPEIELKCKIGLFNTEVRKNMRKGLLSSRYDISFGKYLKKKLGRGKDSDDYTKFVIMTYNRCFSYKTRFMRGTFDQKYHTTYGIGTVGHANAFAVGKPFLSEREFFKWRTRKSDFRKLLLMETPQKNDAVNLDDQKSCPAQATTQTCVNNSDDLYSLQTTPEKSADTSNLSI